MEYVEELSVFGSGSPYDPVFGGGASFAPYSFDVGAVSGIESSGGTYQYTPMAAGEPDYFPNDRVLFETSAIDPPVAAGVTNMDFTTVGQVDNLSDVFNTALSTLGTALQSRIPRLLTGGEQQSIVVNARNCPVGYHQPKTYGKSGGSKNPCIRNRHMNVLNPKALMRATRRLGGFYQFAKKTEKLIQKSFSKAGVHGARRIASKCGTCRKTRCSC